MTTKKKQKTITDSLNSYEEGREIILTMVKAMGKKWPQDVKIFVAGPNSKTTPPGSYRVILGPVVAKGGKDGTDEPISV